MTHHPFKSVIASAPGKLILTGEHAVVHGATCVAAVVDKKTFVVVTPLESMNSW